MRARTPVRQVRFGPPRRGSEPDEAYKKWLRTQRCIVCSAWDIKPDRYALSRVEAAHVGPRGLGQLCPDRQALPLCIWHHTGGLESHHGPLGRNFWTFWKLDRFELIADFIRRYELFTKGEGNGSNTF